MILKPLIVKTETGAFFSLNKWIIFYFCYTINNIILNNIVYYTIILDYNIMLSVLVLPFHSPYMS